MGNRKKKIETEWTFEFCVPRNTLVDLKIFRGTHEKRKNLVGSRSIGYIQFCLQLKEKMLNFGLLNEVGHDFQLPKFPGSPKIMMRN